MDGSPEQKQLVDEPLSLRVPVVPLNEQTDDDAEDAGSQADGQAKEERERHELEGVNDVIVAANGGAKIHEDDGDGDGDGEEHGHGAAHEEDH